MYKFSYWKKKVKFNCGLLIIKNYECWKSIRPLLLKSYLNCCDLQFLFTYYNLHKNTWECNGYQLEKVNLYTKFKFWSRLLISILNYFPWKWYEFQLSGWIVPLAISLTSLITDMTWWLTFIDKLKIFSSEMWHVNCIIYCMEKYYERQNVRFKQISSAWH